MIPGIFYMAHPLTDDEKYLYLRNMDHVLEVLSILLRADLRAIAPYHSQCLILDDKDPRDRSLGISIDCAVVSVVDGIVLTGHKLSKGMEQELQVAQENKKRVINLIGIPDRLLPTVLRSLR